MRISWGLVVLALSFLVRGGLAGTQVRFAEIFRVILVLLRGRSIFIGIFLLLSFEGRNKVSIRDLLSRLPP